MKSEIFLKAFNEKINQFVDELLIWNQKINVVSKKIKKKELILLVEESILIGKDIGSSIVIDAGSGNGLLGIPIALLLPQKKVFLVESIGKKVKVLEKILISLKLPNASVYKGSVREFFNSFHEKNVAIVSRGFPKNEDLLNIAIKKNLREVFLVTAKNKLKILPKNIENYMQNLYNIPWRNHLVIFSISKCFT